MKTLKLYLLDWSPNGTNDLLVVGSEGMECVPEACFGRQGKFTHILNEFGDLYELEDREEPGTWAFEVTYEQVLSGLACNPFDPAGDRKLSEIKRAMREALKVRA